MQVIDLNTSHPDLPGTTRKAVVVETYSNHRANFSSLIVEIQNYKNGELMENVVGRPYQVTLRADNTVFVNPATGEYVPADTPGAMGEYDFVSYLETLVRPQSVNDFKQEVVLRAEAMGRFDI